MKKLLLLLLPCLLMTSCKTTYYQVCEVASSMSPSEKGCYIYNDEACTVTYNFWSCGGNPGFCFTNNTDEIIYIDLSKSFYVRNGFAYDYYLSRSYSSAQSSTVSKSQSAGASATASLSATTYGIWATGPNYGYPGAMAAALSLTNSRALTTVGATTKSSEISTKEKPILGIPPHQSKIVTEYTICDGYFYNCDTYITPKKKEVSKYDYVLLNTPIEFGNYITYRIGSDPKEHHISNDFYVKTVTYNHKKAVIKKRKSGCPGNEIEREVITVASPTKFYMVYEIDRNKFKMSKKKTNIGTQTGGSSNSGDDIY